MYAIYSTEIGKVTNFYNIENQDQNTIKKRDLQNQDLIFIFKINFKIILTEISTKKNLLYKIRLNCTYFLKHFAYF